MAEVDEGHVTQDRRGGQRRQMDGVRAPRLATVTQTPNVSVRLIRYFCLVHVSCQIGLSPLAMAHRALTRLP